MLNYFAFFEKILRSHDLTTIQDPSNFADMSFFAKIDSFQAKVVRVFKTIL